MEGLVITDRRDVARDHTRVLADHTQHMATHLCTHKPGDFTFLLSISFLLSINFPPQSLISYLLCAYTVVGGQYYCQAGDIIL